VKDRLYRTALLYLGSEAMALDAVDEAVYRGFLHSGS
jgi:RNA polymerase sigma-70 factor (ECF subfamily)